MEILMDKTTQTESTIKAKRALAAFIASILVGLSNLAFSSVVLTIMNAFLNLFFVYYLVTAVWIVVKESVMSAANFKFKAKAKTQKKDVVSAAVDSADEHYYDENYSYGDDADAPTQEFPISAAEPTIVHLSDFDEHCFDDCTYGDDSPAHEILISGRELEARALFESGYASFALLLAMKPHSSRFVYGD